MRKNTLRLTAILSMVALLAIPQFGNAQSSIIYGSTRNPLSNSLNPAFFPTNTKVYLSVFGMNLGMHSPVSYNDIFEMDATRTKTYINLNSLLDKMSDNGRMHFKNTINTLGVGVNFDKFFLTLSSQVNIEMASQMPKGFRTFLTEGNTNYTGDNYLELIDGSFIAARIYAEEALGFGYRIDENITVGGRAKLLIGYLDLSDGGNTYARLYTDEDYGYIRGVYNLDLNFSSIMEKKIDPNDPDKYEWEMGNTMLPMKNIGFAFDLGGSYTTDKYEFSLSILDIGPGIHWGHNVQKVVPKDEKNSFTFTGVDISEWMQGGTMDSTVLNSIVDSLERFTKYDIKDGKIYRSSIPMKINLGGMYNFNKMFSAGMHFHGQFGGNMGSYTNTAILGRFSFKEQIEVMASFSCLTNNGEWDWFNPGVGFTFTPGRVFQFYAMLDYISDFYLANAKSFNLSFGINLLFGRTDRDNNIE